ncbi:MAG: hypothetical protein DRI95_13350 [Bacteroidetes bacterium]|nr:MAG: hypothetical protein DRI95_13350 [Bacteroidota bacterium]
MKDLNIKPYHGTIPKVAFDATTGNCEISGESCPENILSFFDDLNNWLYEYIENIKGPISLTLKLSYFNTGSSRGIFRILTILKAYQDKGGMVDITWHYDEDDEDTLEEIHDHSSEANILILKVPY